MILSIVLREEQDLQNSESQGNSTYKMDPQRQDIHLVGFLVWKNKLYHIPTFNSTFSYNSCYSNDC